MDKKIRKSKESIGIVSLARARRHFGPLPFIATKGQSARKNLLRPSCAVRALTFAGGQDDGTGSNGAGYTTFVLTVRNKSS